MNARARPRNSPRENSIIFISYRRRDSPGHAGRLYSDLMRHFGAERVFMDVSGIKGGEVFGSVIVERLASCRVLVAVIGPHWLSLTQSKSRTEPQSDWVLREIATALDKGVRVIPVLVDDAPVLDAAELPQALQPLAARQAEKIADDDWVSDVARLIKIIEQEVPRKRLVWRMIAVAAALVATLAVSYLLTKVRLPVTLGAGSTVHLPTAALGQDEIIIKSPQVNTRNGLKLFSHEARPLEAIDVTLDKARLSRTTVENLELDALWASDFGLITYNTVAGTEQKPGFGRLCSTDVEVLLIHNLPDELHFFQDTGSGGGQRYRDLKVKSVGADLSVTVSTKPKHSPSALDDKKAEEETYDDGLGCWKHLKTQFGEELHYGAHVVESLVAADSVLSFRFLPADVKQPPWGGAEGFFRPFVFGSPKEKPQDPPPGLRAQAVIITRRVSADPPEFDDILDIQSASPQNPLGLDLEVGSSQLRISVAGEGFVKLNGEDVVGIPERIKRYWLTAVMIILTLTALTVCLVLLIIKFLRSHR